MDLTAKLQIKPGQPVAGIGAPDGVRLVRQVAIDETWSAPRLRPAFAGAGGVLAQRR